jgi:hypothetical protein
MVKVVCSASTVPKVDVEPAWIQFLPGEARIMIRRASVTVIAVLAGMLAPPAFAQGYVGAFLVGDVVRLDQYDSRSGDSGSGEAFGFALRLGSPVGAKWGVELEFVRPGEITSDQTPEFLPYVAAPNVRASLPALPNGAEVIAYDPLTFPAYSYRFRSTQRRTTLLTSLWVRQEISPRFSLAYLGGVAFGRTDNETEITYLLNRPTILPIPPIQPVFNESITYDVGPMVGVEGRIRMGGNVDLVPGLRLHGISGGWLIRPAVGLVWTF